MASEPSREAIRQAEQMLRQALSSFTLTFSPASADFSVDPRPIARLIDACADADRRVADAERRVRERAASLCEPTAEHLAKVGIGIGGKYFRDDEWWSGYVDARREMAAALPLSSPEPGKPTARVSVPVPLPGQISPDESAPGLWLGYAREEDRDEAARLFERAAGPAPDALEWPPGEPREAHGG